MNFFVFFIVLFLFLFLFLLVLCNVLVIPVGQFVAFGDKGKTSLGVKTSASSSNMLTSCSLNEIT